MKRKFAMPSKFARRMRRRGGGSVRTGKMSKRGRRVGRRGKFAKAISQHVYSRYGTDPSMVDVTSTEYDFAETMQFGNIKAYTEFTALYDRYRITCVQLQITLINNPNATWPLNGGPAGADHNGTNWYPKFWYCRDYDDDTPITLADMRERSNVKNFILRPNKEYKINVRPAILNQTYRTLTTTGYSPHWKQWIDMVDTNVPHYGLKWVVDTQGLNPDDTYPFKIRVERKYFFTCKDVL